MSDKRDFTAVFILIVLALIWGTSFILIKKGLIVFAPGEVASLRVTSAALFLVPLALTNLKGLKGKDYIKLFASGMIGIFIPAFLFATAQTQISSSVAGIMNCLTPIWTMIIGAIFFSQRFRGYAIVGIIVGFAGTVILIMAKAGGGLMAINWFALLVVLACALYGTNLNFIKFKIPDLRSLTITSVSVVLIGPFAMIYLFGFTDFVFKMKTVDGAWQSLGYLVILGCMGTAIATVLFNKLVKISSPLFTSSVTYLIPIIAVMWGVIDGERLYAGHYIGMITIIAGVYLANRRRDQGIASNTATTGR
jgi:drug/metabolite transporter (DMT)-like permease